MQSRLLLGAGALAALVSLASCQGNESQEAGSTPAKEAAASMAAPASAPAQSPAERGKYLSIIGGCGDCHTPMKMGPSGPEPDFVLLLSGHPESQKLPPPPTLPPGPWMAVTNILTAWSGPWGISYAANITPDSLTGIGIWTEDIFIKAMRTGKHMGTSRPILPPMPWPAIAMMTDDDLKALYAYLRTVPPLHNTVPDPVIIEPPSAPPHE